MTYLDQFLNVGSILQAIRRRNARRQFQFDKFFECNDLYAIDFTRSVRRIWEADGLGFAITRILARRNYFDRHVVSSETQFLLRSLKSRPVTEAYELTMKFLQPIRG